MEAAEAIVSLDARVNQCIRIATMTMSRNAFFDDVLKKYDRVAIVGPPRCGKTTLAKRVKDRPVFWSDDYKEYDWSEASRRIAEDLNALPRFVAEGVAMVRAVRKGLRVDVMLLLDEPLVPQNRGQQVMGAGIMTILDDVRRQRPEIPVLRAPPAPRDYRGDDDYDEEEKDSE